MRTRGEANALAARLGHSLGPWRFRPATEQHHACYQAVCTRCRGVICALGPRGAPDLYGGVERFTCAQMRRGRQ